MGLYDVPEESFQIEIVANDLDALNVKKITSEKVNDEKLLVKADCSVTTKIARTNDWVWTSCAMPQHTPT